MSKRFRILEFDKDTRGISEIFHRDFKSLEEAKDWCQKESWSGYLYSVDLDYTHNG